MQCGLVIIYLEQMPNDPTERVIGMQVHRESLSMKTANSSITLRIRSRTRTMMTGQWQACRQSARGAVERVQYGMTTSFLPVRLILVGGLLVWVEEDREVEYRGDEDEAERVWGPTRVLDTVSEHEISEDEGVVRLEEDVEEPVEVVVAEQ